MALQWNSKILLAKIETTYGTNANPTGGSNGILATEVKLTPMDGNDLSRDLDLPYFAAQGTIPVELHSKLSFKIELSPSGSAGVAPNWGPLLRGCAIAETIVATTSVTYNPITTGQESLTFYFQIEGTLQKITGARGNCTLTLDAQGIPYLEFDFTGLWVTPTEAARDLPTLSGFKKPEAATSTNTPTFSIAATDMVVRSAKLNFGNKVENRFLIGSESVRITGKDESFETTVEAVALGTLNPFALAEAQTLVAVSLVHGTGAGKITTLTIPTAQMQRPQGLENAQGIVEWPLRLVPRPTSGNDQWTLALT